MVGLQSACLGVRVAGASRRVPVRLGSGHAFLVGGFQAAQKDAPQHRTGLRRKFDTCGEAVAWKAMLCVRRWFFHGTFVVWDTQAEGTATVLPPCWCRTLKGGVERRSWRRSGLRTCRQLPTSGNLSAPLRFPRSRGARCALQPACGSRTGADASPT